jgi:hypothetical protein
VSDEMVDEMLTSLAAEFGSLCDGMVEKMLRNEL